MVVTDADLVALVCARGHMLQELKLDKGSGFSTDALRLIACSYRSITMCNLIFRSMSTVIVYFGAAFKILKQSQVRIMGAGSSIQDPEKTMVTIDRTSAFTN